MLIRGGTGGDKVLEDAEMGRIVPPMDLLHCPVLVSEHACFAMHAVLLLVIEELSAIPALELNAITGDASTG